MARTDISKNLIHFTKDSDEEAFGNLLQIIHERCLRGSSNMIKGGHRCVCFSEAPLETLTDGLVNPQYYSKYSPFGIMVTKGWLFENGGRPVIYQTDDEFHELSETHQWRHVRYDPLSDPPIDFTWEREWRIKCEKLYFDSDVASIVVPDEHSEKSIKQIHEDYQKNQFEQLLMNDYTEDVARQFYEQFPWRIFTLR